MKQFIVHIRKKLDPTIEVVKGEGKKCVSLTNFVEKELGKILKREFNKDYYRNMDKDVVVNVL